MGGRGSGGRIGSGRKRKPRAVCACGAQSTQAKADGPPWRCRACAGLARRGQRTPDERPCAYCKTLFRPVTRSRRCCSDACAAALMKDARDRRLARLRDIKATNRMLCGTCGRSFERRIRRGVSSTTGRLRDSGRYCSKRCANRRSSAEVLRRAAARRACQGCGEPREIRRRFCVACLAQLTQRVCVQCGTPFSVKTPSSQGLTCSPACRLARLGQLLRGKQYRPRAAHPGTCATCGKPFTSRQRGIKVCKACVRRIAGNHGKPEARAKRAGVPYVYGIRPEKVFARDGWRCQLCGCGTPKRLRGTNAPNAPEVDHIVPIAAGGGHVWDNVQCACRRCNHRKRAKPLGQMRLAV